MFFFNSIWINLVPLVRNGRCFVRTLLGHCVWIQQIEPCGKHGTESPGIRPSSAEFIQYRRSPRHGRRKLSYKVANCIWTLLNDKNIWLSFRLPLYRASKQWTVKLIKRVTRVRMIRTIDKEISKYLRRIKSVPLFDIIQHVFV